MSMSILRYLKPDKKYADSTPSRTNNGLPDPHGSLSAVIPPAAIESTNQLVLQTQAANTKRKSRGEYLKLNPETRARIGRYAAENGVVAAARHFSKGKELGRPINESTVRGIKKAYLAEMGRKRKAREDSDVDRLPNVKRGRPLLVGQQIDEKIQQYLRNLRDCGGVVNTAITIASAKGIVMSIDRTRLSEYGGHLNLSREWARSLMMRMGFVKRRATTKVSRLTVENFELIKSRFLEEITTFVQMEDIPPELIFNWDQTGTKN